MNLARVASLLLCLAASPALAASPLAAPKIKPPTINAQALKIAIPPAKTKIVVTGSGQGSIGHSTPQKLCGSAKYPNLTACEIVLPLGATTTVKAYPDTGTVFAGWQGACTGAGPCTLQGAGGAMTLTARFDLASSPPPASSKPTVYKLSVATGGEPSPFAWVTSAPVGIRCGGNGTEQCWLNFLAGQEVLLVASVSPSEPRNVEWIGCTPVDSAKKTCRVGMDSDKNVAVIFTVP